MILSRNFRLDKTSLSCLVFSFFGNTWEISSLSLIRELKNEVTTNNKVMENQNNLLLLWNNSNKAVNNLSICNQTAKIL